MGVTLALEEERANGMPVDDQTVQGVKVGMMGPLAGVGDPVFWFTVRHCWTIIILRSMEHCTYRILMVYTGIWL